MKIVSLIVLQMPIEVITLDSLMKAKPQINS